MARIYNFVQKLSGIFAFCIVTSLDEINEHFMVTQVFNILNQNIIFIVVL